MPRRRKLESPVTVFVGVEPDQHEALRTVAFLEHRTIPDVVRQAIHEYLAQHPARHAVLPKVDVTEVIRITAHGARRVPSGTRAK